MQELTYEKKRKLLEDYSSYIQWMDCRVCPESPERLPVAESVSYFKINGIISKREGNTMKQFLSGIYALQLPIVVVYSVHEHRVDVMMGCETCRLDMLRSLAGKILGCQCATEQVDNSDVFVKNRYSVESALIGDTAYKENKDRSIIDLILSEGFCGEYSLVIAASPLSRETGVKLSDYFNDLEVELSSLTSRQITSRDDKDSVSYTEENGFLKRFQDIAENLQKKYDRGIAEGLFFTSVKLFSDSHNTSDLVAGTYISQMEKSDSPEPLQHLYLTDCNYCSDLYGALRHISINGKSIALPAVGNYHTSSELAYFSEPPMQDTLGFFKRIVPDFDVERETKEGVLIGEILKCGKKASDYYLPMAEFNRNILVSGLVGSGKTNTVEHMLMELSKEKVPFLIIEPVKTEYYEMKNRIHDLKIVSVGGKTNGLALNPFQPASESISLQKHVDALYSAVMAAFEWVPPMPQIVEKVIYRVYEDNGFDVANDIRKEGSSWPTIEQAYWTIRTVVKEEKFDARLESDLIGCIGARFNSLRIGNKGKTLNVRESMPLHELFESNCVIELEEIQDEEIRSFIMALLLVNLREYCMLRETSHLNVRHCTVIEEAHTLLRRIDSSSGAAQAKGVKVFSEMIKTLRAKGESFIIVDQVPTELADDVIKNTNLKISHRTVSADDKSVLGKSTNCTEEQEAYLTILNRGEAEVFSEGDFRPKLVRVPFSGVTGTLSREAVLHTSQIAGSQSSLYNMNPPCLGCNTPCNGRYMEEQRISPDTWDEWIERMENITDDEMFEDLCIDVCLAMKRQKIVDHERCVIAKLLNSMHISIQEKHELYAVYQSIQQ